MFDKHRLAGRAMALLVLPVIAIAGNPAAAATDPAAGTGAAAAYLIARHDSAGGAGSRGSGDRDRSRDMDQGRDRIRDPDQLGAHLQDMDRLRERIGQTQGRSERRQLMHEYRNRIHEGMQALDRMQGPGPGASEQERMRYMQQRQEHTERMMQHMWQYQEQLRMNEAYGE